MFEHFFMVVAVLMIWWKIFPTPWMNDTAKRDYEHNTRHRRPEDI